MITTILFGLLALEATALSAILGFCQAARGGDKQLADCADRDGYPEVADEYRLG